MQSLKQAIYKRHLLREREQAEPCPYEDPVESGLVSPEDEDRLRGFAHPEINTVAITVPICNEHGEEYGSRVDLITPQSAGYIIEGNRHEIASLQFSFQY